MIPDSYIDITAEKIRIYKQLDSMTSDKEIERVKSRAGGQVRRDAC